MVLYGDILFQLGVLLLKQFVFLKREVHIGKHRYHHNGNCEDKKEDEKPIGFCALLFIDYFHSIYNFNYLTN